MIRLILLVFPCGIVFTGFAMPFFIDGTPGIVWAIVTVLTGSCLLWLVEKKTRSSLDKDTLLNKILNTDA